MMLKYLAGVKYYLGKLHQELMALKMMRLTWQEHAAVLIALNVFSHGVSH